MLLKVGHNTAYVTHGNIIHKPINPIKPNLAHALADILTAYTQDRSKVFAHHFAVVLYSPCCKCLAEGCAEVVALVVPCKEGLTFFVCICLHLTSHPIHSISSYTDTASRCGHGSTTSHVANNTRGNLCGYIFLCIVFDNLLAETLDGIPRQHVLGCIASTSGRVQAHFYHEGDALCCYFASLITTTDVAAKVGIGSKFYSLCIQQHFLALGKLLSTVKSMEGRK